MNPNPLPVLGPEFPQKTVAFAHQARELLDAGFRRARGQFWEPGTGKTKTALDVAAAGFAAGRLDALLIVAPNGVHRDWAAIAAPEHCAVPFRAAVFRSGSGKRHKAELAALCTPDPAVLRLLSINCESLSYKTTGAEELARQFLSSGRTLLVVDESDLFSSISSERTKSLLRLRSLAVAARILTGTLVTERPMDAYPQLEILEHGALGHHSIFTFKAQFTHQRSLRLKPVDSHSTDPKKRWGRTVRVYAGPKNKEELAARIARWGSVILKKDCLDLPEKIYKRRSIEMAVEQRRIYRQLSDQVITELRADQHLTLPNILARITRLQQCAGGFLPHDEDREAKPIVPLDQNPKLLATLQILNQSSVDDRFLIFARFTAELVALNTILTAAGHSCGQWHSTIPQAAREEQAAAFQCGELRCFLMQVQAARGQNLFAANNVVYFSNPRSLRQRIQSEDRAHRIGQQRPVLYRDLVATGTVDVKILAAHRAKRSLADELMGLPADGWAQWLTEDEL